jgi:predicted DCC family thiol-disulfide oxidoreductase YuxK
MSALTEIRAKRAELQKQLTDMQGYDLLCTENIAKATEALQRAQAALAAAQAAKQEVEDRFLTLMTGDEKLAKAEEFLSSMEDDNELPAPPSVIVIPEEVPPVKPAEEDVKVADRPEYPLWEQCGGNISEMCRATVASRPGRHWSAAEVAAAVVRNLPPVPSAATSLAKVTKVAYQVLRISAERGAVREILTNGGKVYQHVPQVER